MALGKLVVQLGLDAAEFTSGLSKADADAARFKSRIESSSGINFGRNIGLGLAAAATAAVAATVAVDQLIKSVAKFKDIEERIGGSAEGFAALAVPAAVAATSMDEIATISVKLTKNLDGVKGTAKSTAAGLAALNIPLKEFQSLDPIARYEKLAKALDKFADGSGKTAALEAIARGASSLLPFLKELNAQGGRQVVITQAQIELADRYADTQARLGAQIKQQLQKAALEAAPAMLALTQTVSDLIFSVTSLSSESSKLGGNTGIKTFAENAGKALSSLATIAQSTTGIIGIIHDTVTSARDSSLALLKGNLAEAEAIEKAALARTKATIGQVTPSQLFEKNLQADKQKEIDDALALLRAQENAFRSGKKLDKPPVPKIADFAISKAPKVPKDDPTNRILDGQIRALEASVARERDILNAQQNFLRDNFNDGYLSVADYYSRVQKARDDALNKTLVAYDKEIAAIKAVQAKREKATEREGDENRINDVREKQANLIRDTTAQEETLKRERTRAAEQYVFQLDEINAKMLELSGNTAKAATIRFDAANAVFNRSLKASGNTEALAQQDSIRRQLEVQGQLNDKNKEFQIVLEQVGISQERLNLQQQTGAVGEIAALNKRSELNKALIPKLQEIAAAYEKIAQSSKDPAALNQVEQLKLAIERLSAETDLLARKFNDLFAGSFANAFGDFISGTKSAKDAFKDFTKDITRQLNQIASQNIADALFKGGGPLSGVGGFFADLFSGGKAATKVADPAAAASVVAAKGLGSLTVATETASSALLTFSSKVSESSLLGAKASPAAPDTSAFDKSVAGLSANTLSTTSALQSVASTSAATARAMLPLNVGFNNLNTTTDTLAGVLGSTSKDILADLSNGIFVDTSSVDRALSGLDVAASSTTQSLLGVTRSSGAIEGSFAPITASLSSLDTAAIGVSDSLLATSKSAGSFADFFSQAPKFDIDTSAFDAATTSTASALTGVARAGSATESAMDPLRSAFGALSTSTEQFSASLLSIGKKGADAITEQLSKVVPTVAPIDTSALLALDTAASDTTRSLLGVTRSSDAIEGSFAPITTGLSSLATTAGSVSDSFLETGKSAGLFADLLSQTQIKPPAIDTSALVALDSAANKTTSALDVVARASATTTSALEPLTTGLAGLNESAQSVASALSTSGKDLLADLSNAIVVDTSAFDKSLFGLDTAVASTSSSLASVASASAATDLAMTPLTAGFSGLSTSVDSVANLFAGFQLPDISIPDISIPDIAIPDIAIDTSAFAGLNVAAQNTTSALATVANVSAATELSMTPLSAGFAGLSTSADNVSTALLATGKDAGLFADFLSKTASSPGIVVDTSQLLGLNEAATRATSAFTATELAITPLSAGLSGLGASAESVTTAFLSVGKGAGGLLNNFLDDVTVSPPIAVDTSALLGLNAAAASGASSLTTFASASTATELALTPLTAGFAGLGASADTVATALIATSKDAGLFANVLSKTVAPTVDTSQLLGLNEAAQRTTSAFNAADLAIAPLGAEFASLGASAETVAASFLSAGKGARGLLADFLSDTTVVNAPPIPVDTSALVSLNAAAASSTSALATLTGVSAATEHALTPLSTGFTGLSTSADSVSSVLLSTSKDAGLFADFLNKAASSPGIVVDTSQLTALNATAVNSTNALASLASTSAATDFALTPLQSSFAGLGASADTIAKTLFSTGKSASSLADFLSDTTATPIEIDTSAFNAATASSAFALSSFASTSAATDLALTPLTAGFSGLSTATNSAVSTLLSFESSKDVLSNLFGSVDTSGAVSADAALISLSSAATTTAAAMTTVATTSGITELAITSLGAGFITLTASAQTAAAALLQVAGSKGAGAMGDLFSEFAQSALGGLAQGGGYVMGGNPPIGRASLVGERGPELFVPKVSGTIVPNNQIRTGGDTVTNTFHFNLPPNTTSQSASQMALEVGRRVAQVMRRKN